MSSSDVVRKRRAEMPNLGISVRLEQISSMSCCQEAKARV